jgi:hypothetical protein
VSTIYDLDITAYKVGDRVQAHPATSAWISGDRYGSVKIVGSKHIAVRMDRSGLNLIFTPRNLGKVSS